MRQLLYKLGSVICFLSFSACFSDEGNKIDAFKYEGPNLTSFDLNVDYTDSARLTMNLIAKEQLIFENDNQEFPKGIFVTFYDEAEKISSTIKSNYAYYIVSEDKWKLTGDVLVDNKKKNEKLETQELYWQPEGYDTLVNNEELIVNITVDEKDSVKVTTPDQELKGNGLIAKDDFSYYKIKKVRGITYLK